MQQLLDIEFMPKGTRTAYHTGFLAIDRSEDNARVSQRKRFDEIASAAYQLYLRGIVSLVQRRLDAGVFTYEAVRL